MAVCRIRIVVSAVVCAGCVSFLAMGARAVETGHGKSDIKAEAKLATKAFQLPEGFTLETVASEPHLANPVAFCFDPNGRIFVAETYRVEKGVEDNRHHGDWLDEDLAARTVADRVEYYKRHLGDQISKYTDSSEQVRLLEDRDKDGVYETSSVFSTGYKNIEDGAAAGVMWSGDKLLFTCIPTLWALRDKDGDGKAEEREALSTGYGVHTAFYGHDMHGLVDGPDGKVYFSIGDRGLNVDTPRGKLVNPDSGAVLRCNPDGSELEIFATGLRNPQELAFNEVGDLFTVDNNCDSGDKARLVHVVEGMDSGWRMYFQYLEDRGPFNREKIWHTQNNEQPASMVPPLTHIADGPSGLVHYPGTGLPAEYNGAFFLVDFRGAPTTSSIHQFYVKPKGATYELKEDKPFLRGALATDCDFGPTGEFFVLDWVEGWKGPGVGRVHRLTCNDPATAKQRAETHKTLQSLPQASADELLKLLEHADVRVRLGAQRRLVAAGAQSAQPLEKLAASPGAPQLARLHAIWALGQLAEQEPKNFSAIVELAADNDAEVRAQAAKTLGRAAKSSDEVRGECGTVLTALLGDAQPRVRSLAAISLGKLKHKAAVPKLLELAKQEGEDPTMRHAVTVALAGILPAEKLLGAADGASDLQRLVIVVALGKQRSPIVAKLLTDKDPRVALEAARIIWDTPLPEANGQLAAIIKDVPSTAEPLLRRAIAANVAERKAENLQAVIEVACRPDLTDAMRELAWKQVRGWAKPAGRDSVDGKWRAIAEVPEVDVATAIQAALPKLVGTSATNPAGVVVAAELGIEDAYGPLQAVLTNDKLPADVRAQALAAFGKANDAQVHQAIDAGLESTAATVRAAARKLWADRFPAEVVERLRDTIDSGTVREKQSAIDTLAGLKSAEAGKIVGTWMGRLEEGKCPPEIAIEILEAAGKSPDGSLVERQKKFAEKLAATGAMSKYSICLEGGDNKRGRKVFESNEAVSCRRCHSVKPGEMLVGPNLASVGVLRKPTEILESIVDPNAKICEGFETAVLQMDDGKVVTGIIRSETKDKILVIDAEAKLIEVDTAAVEERVKGKSAMSEGLAEKLTQRELRDLIAYLGRQKAPVEKKEGGAAQGK